LMEPLKCAKHPNTETNLLCGKCEKPICPKCMVETPVGMRCSECARINKLPTFQVNNKQMLLAVSVGLLIALVYGFLWGVISLFVRFIFLNLLFGAGAGFVISEGMSRVINRKRGTKLVIAACILVFLSGLVSVTAVFGTAIFTAPLLMMLYFASIVFGIYVAFNRLR